MAASLMQVCSPSGDPIKIFRWKVKKDSTVTKGAVLALYEVQKNGQNSDPLKLKATDSGIVSEILVESGCVASPGTVLITLRPQSSGGCTHPTVMKDMCADCGADLRREPGIAGDRKEAMTASVAMVHNIPELIISQEQALELGREDEQRLLKTRKLVLLVDLDQTLIHTTNDSIPPNLKDVFHFQMWQGPHSTWYHTRLRPHTRTFLERVSQMYELHICTFGVRLYAHTVARLIDPDERYFSHRILSRDECFDPLSKTANLKALFPCGDSMVGIIDDREDVWNFAPNLVHVKPYRFFQGTADINAPPGLTKMENDNVPITHKVVGHHSPSTETQSASADDSGAPEREKEAPDKDSGDASAPDSVSVDSAKDSGIGGSEEAQAEKDSPDRGEEDMDDDKEEGQNAEGKSAEEELADDLRISSESDSGPENNSNDRGKGESPQTDEVKQESSHEQTLEKKDISDRTGENMSQTVSVNGGENVNQTVSESGGENVNQAVSESDGRNGSDSVTGESSSGALSTEQSQTGMHAEGGDTLAEAKESCETENGEVTKEVKKEEANKEADGAGDTQDAASDDKTDAQEEEIEWDDDDDYLLHLEDILGRIHKAFYTMYDEGRAGSPGQSSASDSSSANEKAKSPSETSEADATSTTTTIKNLPDLKSIIPYVKRKTLKGCNIVFSGLVPLNTPLEKSSAYIVAKAFGATVQPDILGPKVVSDKRQATTHLVAQKPGTGKHKTAQRMRYIHIVNSGWLWACAERWEQCDEQLFPLGRDPKDEGQHPRKEKSSKKGGQKRKSGDRDAEEDDNEDDVFSSDQKRQKKEEEEESKMEEEREQPEGPADQLSEGEISMLAERSGASINPLLSFSDEDLECMDKEVDELLAEGVSDSSEETEGERDERMRKAVLGNPKDSAESSSDSMTGELPRGWGLRRKSLSPQDDDLDRNKRKEMELETEDTENELTSFQKTMEAFAPDTESNSSIAESIGSVDDEIADAVEKEFLSSL